MSLAHSLWKRIEYRDKIHHANVLRSFPDELVESLLTFLETSMANRTQQK